ncbi:MAG: fasciclin domain-containing protein [Proteobacteria bacterium]|nr:MAG: fasciclin domain-containing protein [Pseudomonadota bacterium]
MLSAILDSNSSLGHPAVPTLVELIDPTQDDVLQAARNRGGANVFVSAIETLGWQHWFEFPGPMTYFIPSDEVFRSSPSLPLRRASCVRWMQQADTALEHGLFDRYTAQGQWTAEQLSEDTPLLDGFPITVSRSGVLTVNGAHVVKPDIESKNGIIHIINSLFPIKPDRLRTQPSRKIKESA